MPTPTDLPAETDVAIVGSGFSGLAMAARLRRAGRDDYVVLERAADVGGVWRDNTYPGAACDVPSHVYSLSFAQNPDWTRTYSHQDEILAYLRDVAAREGILEHCVFDCEVTVAGWDAGERRWAIETSRGTLSARVLVSAAGPLVEPVIPDVPGLEGFDGTVFHSARWNHHHDLAGERVAVVGTGASAIQFVPQIQPEVGSLTLFQRTAPWVLPRTERPITGLERAAFRYVPGAQKLVRSAVFWLREAGATPLLRAPLAPVMKAIGLVHLHRSVRDAELRAKLTPGYTPGCKRLLLSNDYLPALEEPNVEVVDAGLVEVRGNTVVGADGSEREVDTIIFGTGFEVTRPPIAERIHDRYGRALSDHWTEGMEALRGTAVAGFPNLFLLLGPNTGSGHMSVVFMAEAQADYVLQALAELDRRGAAAVEPRREAQDAWSADVQERSRGTVWLDGGCTSWYLDGRGHNTTLWPDYAHRFNLALRRFDAGEHEFAPAPARRHLEPVAA